MFEGYGQAGNFRLVSPWSLFRIGSISKTVTAVGALKLIEQGRLHLGDLVFGRKGILHEVKLDEDSDERLKNITVLMLLTHTAGWDQRIGGDPLLWRGIGASVGKPDPSEQNVLIDYVLKRPLQFDPGISLNLTFQLISMQALYRCVINEDVNNFGNSVRNPLHLQ